MNKYVIKVYNTGIFYGYFAKHPDNKAYTYYVNEISNAIVFNSFDEADNEIERIENGSSLQAIVISYEEELNNKIKEVWTIDRNTIEDGEQGTPIYVISSYKEAIKTARKLNKKYGQGVVFTKEFDFDETITDDNYLYYNVGSYKVYSKIMF